jgi:hypothetical protein
MNEKEIGKFIVKFIAGKDCSVRDFQSRIVGKDELYELAKALTLSKLQIKRDNYGITKDGICYYCGELTDNLSGNSSKWGIPLFHKDEPGKVKAHHIGCVMERLEPHPENKGVITCEECSELNKQGNKLCSQCNTPLPPQEDYIISKLGLDKLNINHHKRRR